MTGSDFLLETGTGQTGTGNVVAWFCLVRVSDSEHTQAKQADDRK